MVGTIEIKSIPFILNTSLNLNLLSLLSLLSLVYPKRHYLFFLLTEFPYHLPCM